MRLTTRIAALAALLSADVCAQTLRHDGLLNSSLGAAQIAVGANDQLVVSNIGSSGQDGVRVALGSGQGASLEPTLQLAPGGSCALRARVRRAGTPQLANVGFAVVDDGSGTGALYTPDYAALGRQTYHLRVKQAGQVVYDGGGHTGATRMHGGGGLNSLPQKVYMLTMPFGPWGGAFLGCFDHGGGGVIVTPPGGVPVQGDFVEFMTDPGQIVGVADIELTAADVAGDLHLSGEVLRHMEHWMVALDGAHIDAEPNGKLKISNLGSSGCDGVSIVLPDETDEVEAAMDELAAPQTPGGLVELDSTFESGERDELRAQEAGGEWGFAPDFSALGSQTYTLELLLQGQTVFVQTGMTGIGASTASWTGFSKRVVQNGDGTISTEWLIEAGSARSHRVAGGPTLLADAMVLRSGAISVVDAGLSSVSVRGNDLAEPLYLLDVDEPGDCVGDSYCVAGVNSVGAGAHMCSSGSASVAANDLVLTCSDLPPNQFGLFYYGTSQDFAPLGNGFRCVGGQLFRLPMDQASGAGVASRALDNTAPPHAAGLISAGDTWTFQFWYRDPAGGGAGFNLSDAHVVTFTP